MTKTLSLRDWAMVLLLGLASFLPGLASLPPVDRDEARYVVASQRMADTGDVIDIRYQDEPRYLQPVGIYWLQALATTVLDSPAHDSIWAYRIPSLLGALLAIALTGWIGALYFGRNAGLAAAALLAVNLSLNFEARIAKTDAVLLASIVAAQLALMRAYTEPVLSRATAALFWVALGIGLLVKGPVILIVAGATIAALLAWDCKAAWLLRLRPVWGVPMMLAIVLPWYIAIGMVSDGAFYERAVARNMLGKVGAGEQGHSGPFGYHLALFAVFFWPGCLLALRAIPYVWRERAAPAVRFLLCWIVPTWIVFEIVVTKLPHYVLPTYPAIACLAAAALFAPAPSAAAGRIVFAIVAALWLVLSALVSAAAPYALWQVEDEVNAVSLSLAVLGLGAAGASLYLLWKQRPPAMVGALAVAGVLAWGNFFGYAAPRLDSLWLSPRIVAAARAARQCESGVLTSTPYHEPSLVFLHGRTRTTLANSGADAAQALAGDVQCGLALVDVSEQPGFLARAESLGLGVRPASRITGRNYSNNNALDLTLYHAGAVREGESAAR